MSVSFFELISFKFMPGAVMGCQPATLRLYLRVRAPTASMLSQVRHELVSLWPQWLGPETASDSQEEITLCAARLLWELIIALQLESGVVVSGQVRVRQVQVEPASVVFEVFLPSGATQASHVAVRWAIGALNALLSGTPMAQVWTTVAQAQQDLRPFVESGVNNFFILRAAHALRIPVFRPIPGWLVLGMGVRSRWLQSLVSDLTPALSIQAAQGKHMTALLLRQAGLPGGVHYLVKNPEQALEAARLLGYPVVVKPADADRGAGVAADLRDPESVASAFDVAVKVSSKVLVERWVPGHTHRLTVQDGEVIRVVRRMAGGVVGDGVHTVAGLVELFQQTTRQQRMARRLGHAPLVLDDEALILLQQQGITRDHSPAVGHYVRLRRRDNVNAGGTNHELDPDDPVAVHPDNLRLAIEAARLLRLDFAGIDLITTDISRSWLDCEALICEVNARPQMGANHDPGLYQRLLVRMFPNGFRIPTELVVVPSDEELQQGIRDSLLATRLGVSVSLTDGLWIEGRRVTRPWANSFQAAVGLLQRREVSHAICLMTPRDIQHFGLPIPHWDFVTVDAKLAFTPDERKLLGAVRDWLDAAVLTP